MPRSQNHGACASNDDARDETADQHDEGRADGPDEHPVIACRARAADQPSDNREHPRFAGRSTEGGEQQRNGHEPRSPPPGVEAGGEILQHAGKRCGNEASDGVGSYASR